MHDPKVLGAFSRVMVTSPFVETEEGEVRGNGRLCGPAVSLNTAEAK